MMQKPCTPALHWKKRTALKAKTRFAPEAVHYVPHSTLAFAMRIPRAGRQSPVAYGAGKDDNRHTPATQPSSAKLLSCYSEPNTAIYEGGVRISSSP